jgi:hypothetical protein
VEVRKRENRDSVVVRLHKVHRKAWCFHLYYKVMWRGDHLCLEEADVWEVPGGGPLMGGGVAMGYGCW